jgi:hypothetical protein
MEEVAFSRHWKCLENNFFLHVSFVSWILLTKSLLCNVAVINRDVVYFRIFKVFRVYFSKTEKSLIMTGFSVTSFKKAISVFQEDSVQFPTQKNSDPLFPSGWPSDLSRRPLVSRSFWTAPDLSGCHGNTSRRSSEFEKISVFLCRHELRRQPVSVQTTGQYCPDAVLDKEITCR